MALPPFDGILGVTRAAHLLRRSAFGATKQQIDQFALLTPQQAIALLFRNDLPDPPLPIDTATGETFIGVPLTDANSGGRELENFFLRWSVGQMLSAGVVDEMQISFAVRERITLFMHTHFTARRSVINNARSLYFQNTLFRAFSFDRFGDDTVSFRELTKKISVDNAMLRFLDGRDNVEGNPNENYARELMELYSIGRGLEGTLPPITDPGDYINFTEEDVQAAARVFSGFTTELDFTVLDPETGIPRGATRGAPQAPQHDNGVKQFSDRFGNATISPDPLLVGFNGQATEESALDEISQFVDLLYAREETARNICRRIYRFFVYHSIPQDLDDTIIANMAQTFIDNGFKIQPVLEDLFQSQHFYDGDPTRDDDNFGGIIKSPIDLVVGTMRFFDISIPDYVNETEAFYELTGNALRWSDRMGMDFYQPFEVAGYSAYHQFPVYNRNWISTNFLAQRYNFIQQTVQAMMPMPEPGMIAVDVLDFVRNTVPVGVAENARSLIMELVRYLLPVSSNLTFEETDDNADLTSERLNFFRIAFLFSPQIDSDPETVWTFRYNNPVDDEVVSNQLQSLFNALLQTPEYQLA